MKKTLLMKKLMKKALLTFATLLLVVACSKDDKVNNPTEENNNFPFLKEGNSWTYTKYNIELDNTYITEEMMTLKYKVDTIYNSKKYFLYFGEIKTIDNGDTTDRGDWVPYIATDSTVSEENPDLPLFWKNYTLNKKWFYYYEDDENDYSYSYSREIISTNETVEVEAGIFYNCIKIIMQKDDEDDSWRIFYIRNDIGIIKIERKDFKMELKSKNFN